MATTSASGSSLNSNATAAAAEAIGSARRKLSGRQPSFGFVFASPKLNLGEVLVKARALCPGTDLIGCSSAGEITERGLTRGGLSVLLVSAEGMTHSATMANDVGIYHARAADELGSKFKGAQIEARAQGHVVPTTVLLVDGLCGSGEVLVDELRTITGSLNEIVGGAAGDDGRFEGTHVGVRDKAALNSVAALHVFGGTRWGVGVDHGLTPATKRMRVTKASGNRVYELDGKPAFAVYEEYARERGVQLSRDNAPSFLINNELGVFGFDVLKKARAPLNVAEDGALTCAAEIPQGATVCILGGSEADLLAAARRAAEEARERLDNRKPAGVLLFDCICRGTILGANFGREIEAVRSVFPDVPIAGLLTYGEIARYSGRLEGWHNTTAVIAAIPA